MDLKPSSNESSTSGNESSSPTTPPKCNRRGEYENSVHERSLVISPKVATEKMKAPPKKIKAAQSMPPFNHDFYKVENNIIVEFDFTLLNVHETPSSDIFRVSSLFSFTVFPTYPI